MKTFWQTMIGTLAVAVAFSVFAEDAASRPLPPVETILERLLEASGKEGENEYNFKHSYIFTRTKVTEYRNAKDRLKRRKERESLNDPTVIPGAQPIQPSEPLSKSDEDKENESVSEANSKVRGKAFDKDEFIVNADLLSRFDFYLVGRENVGDRSTFALDFKPANRELPVRNIKDRFINKAAGRIWVDEDESALVKADLHLTEKVNVVGGLIGAIREFAYRFERVRTGEGYWFTRTVDWHLEGRELFFQRTVDYHERMKDLRKAWEPAVAETVSDGDGVIATSSAN